MTRQPYSVGRTTGPCCAREGLRALRADVTVELIDGRAHLVNIRARLIDLQSQLANFQAELPAVGRPMSFLNFRMGAAAEDVKEFMLTDTRRKVSWWEGGNLWDRKCAV